VWSGCSERKCLEVERKVDVIIKAKERDESRVARDNT
jgi:hypothetical protein